jgi:hypothetical protein
MSQSCDTCALRGPWRDQYVNNRTIVTLAECNADDVSAFWKLIGEKPTVMPGAGTQCKQYKPTEATLVEVRDE